MRAGKPRKEHMEYFIDIFETELSTEYKLLKWQVSHQRKMLNAEWRVFITCVYLALIIYKALAEYAKDADRYIDSIKGGVNHSIIPDMVKSTYDLLCECLGDCDVLSEPDIKESKNRVLEMIRCVRFSGDIRHKRVNGKTLYERYLEEKMGLPKAPNGTTKKLMKEFGIKSEYKYHQLLREMATP